MKLNRRRFVSTWVGGGLAPLPVSAHGAHPLMSGFSPAGPASSELNSRYSRLDEILKRPVLKKDLFAAPVIIRTRAAPSEQQLSVQGAFP